MTMMGGRLFPPFLSNLERAGRNMDKKSTIYRIRARFRSLVSGASTRHIRLRRQGQIENSRTAKPLIRWLLGYRKSLFSRKLSSHLPTFLDTQSRFTTRRDMPFDQSLIFFYLSIPDLDMTKSKVSTVIFVAS
jgi:hypothetical protein